MTFQIDIFNSFYRAEKSMLSLRLCILKFRNLIGLKITQDLLVLLLDLWDNTRANSQNRSPINDCMDGYLATIHSSYCSLIESWCSPLHQSPCLFCTLTLNIIKYNMQCTPTCQWGHKQIPFLPIVSTKSVWLQLIQLYIHKVAVYLNIK